MQGDKEDLIVEHDVETKDLEAARPVVRAPKTRVVGVAQHRGDRKARLDANAADALPDFRTVVAVVVEPVQHRAQAPFGTRIGLWGWGSGQGLSQDSGSGPVVPRRHLR